MSRSARCSWKWIIHPGQGHRERLCHQTDGHQASVRTPAPQLGQNNRDIFEGVLGMTEEQFNTLHEKQVF